MESRRSVKMLTIGHQYSPGTYSLRFKIHFNIILLSAISFPVWSHTFRIFSICCSLLSHTLHVQCISFGHLMNSPVL
jgi:hypothetical protein